MHLNTFVFSTLALFPLAFTEPTLICKEFCDGAPAELQNTVEIATFELYGRQVSFQGHKEGDVVFGKITEGKPGDQLWLDRWFDFKEQVNDGKRLGLVAIANGSTEATTNLFNVDGDVRRPHKKQVGVIRLCAKIQDHDKFHCTGWNRVPVCIEICDNSHRSLVHNPIKMDHLHDLQIDVMTSIKDRVIYGRLYNVEPGTEVWLDRSWDGGLYWTGFLGHSTVPYSSNETYTTAYNVDHKIGSPLMSVIRVCTRKRYEGVFCTNWLQPPICGKVCDNATVENITDSETVAEMTLLGRRIELVSSPAEAVAYGRLSEGSPNDEIWLDRSWDYGKTVADSVGISTIPLGDSSVTTHVFNYQSSIPVARVGQLRACGKIGDDFACTDWKLSETSHYSEDIILKST